MNTALPYIESFNRGELSVEMTLIQISHARVSVRRVVDITKVLWSTRVRQCSAETLIYYDFMDASRWFTRSNSP